MLAALARRMRASGPRRRGRVCCVASDRALPHQQRVWRLGYRPSQLHVCQRRSSVDAPGRVGGIGSRNLRRRDDRLSQSISQRAGREASRAERQRKRRSGSISRSLPALLDRQQQVNQAGALVADYLAAGRRSRRVARHARQRACCARIATSTRSRISRPRSASTRSSRELAAAAHVLIATTRYLAAHAPTVRAQAQTYQIALRLNRGEHVFDEQ